MAESFKGTLQFDKQRGVFTLKQDPASARLEDRIRNHKKDRQARLWAYKTAADDPSINVTFDDCGCLKIQDAELCIDIEQRTAAHGDLRIKIRGAQPPEFALVYKTEMSRGNAMCPCEFEP